MPKISVEIVGDASSLSKAYRAAERDTRLFGRSMERAGRGAVVASVGFHGLGRAVGYASASFLGAAGLVTAVKAGFNEMLAGQAVAADTAAVLRSTGRVAGVTAKEVSTLATSLQQLSGYDDEAIASAENLILTFTNVRDVAGKNNDIFTQTIKSTLDLSRRFGQDLSTSAVQLGKALQDPIKGVTALRRAGVSFSSAQQRLINRLVTTGHLLEAQKIILKEVRVETGNAAAAYGKTMAGQVDILKGNLTNLAGELANVLNPEVKKLTTRFNAWLANPENKKKIIDDWTASVHALGTSFNFAADTAGALKSAWDKIPNFGGAKGKGLIEILRDAGKSSLFRKIAGTMPPPSSAWGGPLGLGAAAAAIWGNPSALASGAASRPSRGGAARPGGRVGGRKTGEANRIAAQQNAWFDAMIGRELVDVADVTTIKGRIARLKEISAQITARIAVTKDITRKLNLEDQVKSIARDRRSFQEELGQMAVGAKQQAIETRMGWLDFAAERADATKGIKDDVRVQQAVIKFLQGRIKHEGRTLELVRGIWEARQKIIDLNKKNADVDPLAGLMQVSSKQLANILAAGTGLDAAGRRRLGANIAGAEIRPVHVHVNLDGREVASVVTKHQARTSSRTARQTSGYRG